MDEDREGFNMDLESLMGLPDFHEANNSPLPFGVKSSLRIGVFGEFLRVAPSGGLIWDDRMENLMKRAGKLGLNNRPPCIPESVDFVLTSITLQQRAHLRVESREGETKLVLGDSFLKHGKSAIEVWEAGALIRKTTFPGRRNQTLTEIRNGIALSIRFTGEEEGIEVLAAEDEFSREQWGDALVYSLLDGRIRVASRILRDHLLPSQSAEASWLKLQSFLATVIETTRSVPFGLAPTPLVRGASTPDLDCRKCRFPSVHQGIRLSWPEVDGESPGAVDSQPSDLRDFLESAFSPPPPASTFPPPLEQSSSAGSDPCLANGWAALKGWRLIESRRYEEAYEAFASTTPVEGDPFNLAGGAALAKHLASTNESGAIDLDSNDAIWAKILPTI